MLLLVAVAGGADRLGLECLLVKTSGLVDSEQVASQVRLKH